MEYCLFNSLNEDAQLLLCGADRENYHIQCLNSNTREFQRQIRVELKDNIEPIYAIEFAPNTNGTVLFAFTGDLSSETFSKRIYLSDENFRLSLLIMAFFAIPVLLAIIIGCIVRIRNLCKNLRLNTFLNHVKNKGTRPTSVLGNWMNRRKGFENLDQYSDGENEPLNNDIPTNSHDDIEPITTICI